MAAATWVGSGILGQGLRLVRGRHQDPSAWPPERRRAFLLDLEHASLAVTLLTGSLLLYHRGWGLGRARWLAVKLGLVAFLVIPLESMHAYVNHVLIPRSLRGALGPPLPREFLRGMGMDNMIRTLSLPLLGLAVPILVWLSVAKPF